MLTGGVRVCTHCDGEGHTAFNCPRKPKKQLQSTKRLVSKKRMRKQGKVGKALAKQAREYRKENPPNHEGYYSCYLCSRWVPADEMNVEHTKSKARHPEFRFDKGKLKPACGSCNEKKRSMDVEEVQEMQRRGLW